MIKRFIAQLHARQETLYLITFAVYLASVTIMTTTFYVFYPHRVGTVIQLLTVAVLLGKIVLFDELSTKETICEVGLVGLVTIVALISSAHYLVTTVFLVLGAREVAFRKIVKVYLAVVGGILLIAFIAAEVGLIQNITFATDDGLRQSFGVVYTTDFAAHIFYLCCGYLYLKARRFRPVDFLPVVLGLGVIYYYTRTMTDTIAMIVLLICFTAYVYRRQLGRFKLVTIGLRYNFLALPVVSALIIWLTTIFDFNDGILRRLNDLLSTRLALGNNGLLAYGVKFLGQPWIAMNGWGGDRSETFTDGIGNLTYFFIDSSFLNMLIAYGLVLTLIIIIGMSFFLYQRTKHYDYLLPVVFVAIAISSAFDQHFLEVTYNVFILVGCAQLPRYQTKLGPDFEQVVVIPKINGGG